MTLTLTNIKFIGIDSIDSFPQLNFTADYTDDEDNEIYPLIIAYRPTVTADDDYYPLYFNIDGQSHTDEIDYIDDSQYFDDDAIAFFIETARNNGFGA